MTERAKRERAIPPFEAYHGDKPFIFVSYSHNNQLAVYNEIARLHRLGYRIWYDEGIQLGSEFSGEVAKAIINCSLFLVFVTPAAVVSRHIQNEINFALKYDKKFLAIYLEKTTLPEGLELQIGTIQSLLKYKHGDEWYLQKILKALPGDLMRFSEDTLSPLPLFTAPEFLYDVYLTSRNLDDRGHPTADSTIADNIYHYLSGKGLKVFHPIHSIARMGVGEAEKAVAEALGASRIMVVIGTSPENMVCEKVRLEWKRFNRDIGRGFNANGIIISYIKGFDKSLLPETLGNGQTVEDDPGAPVRLYKIIAEIPGMPAESCSAPKELSWPEHFEKGHNIYLIRINGSGQDKVMVAPGDIIRVGRENDNDLILNPDHVSRKHARVIYSKEGLAVEDLKSRNGTFVNNRQVTWQRLKPDDVVRFDSVSYKVCFVPEKNCNED